jgi:hypothetical protein
VLSAIQVFWFNLFGCLTVAWVPGGIAGDIRTERKELLRSIRMFSRGRVIFCRISLLRPENSFDSSELDRLGWVQSHRFIGARETFVVSRTTNNLADITRLSSNWRRNLNRGLKRDQVTSEWSEPNALEIHKLFKQLNEFKGSLGPKKIPSTNFLDAIIATFKRKLLVVQTRDSDGNLRAIRGAYLIGPFALDALAASNEIGRQNYSSYVCAWRLLEILDQRGIELLDLAGIDQATNEGVFNFKKGLGGARTRYLGEWEAASPRVFRRPLAALISRLS